MNLTNRKALFCLCTLLLSLGSAVYAQTEPQPQTPPPPQPAEQKKTESQPPVPLEERPYTSDGQFSMHMFFGLTSSHPFMRTGRGAPTNANPSDLDFTGKTQPVRGGVLSIPAGGRNTLRISYLRLKGQGNTTAGKDLNFFGTDFSKGDYLSMGYKLHNVKASLDFLSWPFPVKEARFLVKTLWEVQYTTIRAAIGAPLKLDSNGTLSPAFAFESESFVTPSLGMGVEYLISRNFRWEAKASGFVIPHHTEIWDVETFGAVRHRRVEFVFGGRGFHFKTSSKREQYLRGTFPAVYAGLRWYPKL